MRFSSGLKGQGFWRIIKVNISKNPHFGKGVEFFVTINRVRVFTENYEI